MKFKKKWRRKSNTFSNKYQRSIVACHDEFTRTINSWNSSRSGSGGGGTSSNTTKCYDDFRNFQGQSINFAKLNTCTIGEYTHESFTKLVLWVAKLTHTRSRTLTPHWNVFFSAYFIIHFIRCCCYSDRHTEFANDSNFKYYSD